MQSLNDLLTVWAINKIAQYKQDQLKMTLEEARSSDLYANRDKTIAFITIKAIKRLNAISATA